MSDGANRDVELQTRDEILDTSRQVQVSVPFRTYLPDGYRERGQRFPLLLYLHGSGECGDDLNLLERAGLPAFLRSGLKSPFVVACPQCRETWQPDDLTLLLDHLLDRYHLDPTRLYLCGVSLGAMGVWLLSNRIAHRIAAAVPICGPAVRIDPENYRGLPVRCIHGALDSVVGIGESVKMVRALRSAGCDVTFDIHPDADHDVWKHCFRRDLWDWLLSHHR